MGKLYIGFSKSTKKLPIFSWLIRLIESTPYSHTYVKLELHGKSYIFEAVGNDCRLILESEWEKKAQVVEEVALPVTVDILAKTEKFIAVNTGKPYGILQLIGVILGKWLNLKYNITSRGRSALICSELVGRFLEEVMGFKLEKEPDLLTPLDIYEFLGNINNYI